MAISPVLFESLKAVGTVMDRARDPWWIIASAAVSLHGADAGDVSDVDVLLSVTDARRLLPPLEIEIREGTANEAFRSRIFGTWTGTAVPVEFMADFHYFSDGRWVPVAPVTRRPVELRGVTVFVPEKPELLAMLAAFGRPKDMERFQRLAAVR